jgi:hypothetical protein
VVYGLLVLLAVSEAIIMVLDKIPVTSAPALLCSRYRSFQGIGAATGRPVTINAASPLGKERTDPLRPGGDELQLNGRKIRIIALMQAGMGLEKAAGVQTKRIL